MTVCLFGNYIKDYPRIQMIVKGLQQNQVTVLPCHTRAKGLKKYWQLFQQHRRIAGRYDVMLVAMGGYNLVWFARLLTRRPVVFDVFVSLYLTNVSDREVHTPGSLAASKDRMIDKWSCKLARHVLLDTQAHIDYFVRNYNLPPQKFSRIFVGADPEIYKNQRDQRNKGGGFVVHWHGHIVPFHGLDVIILTAKILQDQPIHFQLVTRFNSKYEAAKQQVADFGLQNITFYPETDYQGLAAYMNNADICLGVFGRNDKGNVVIPNKIFESLACGKPVITAKTPAITELFTDQENIILTEANDPEDLAEKIMLLYKDNSLRNKIAENAYQLYQAKLTPQAIGRDLKQVLEQLTSPLTPPQVLGRGTS